MAKRARGNRQAASFLGPVAAKMTDTEIRRRFAELKKETLKVAEGVSLCETVRNVDALKRRIFGSRVRS